MRKRVLSLTMAALIAASSVTVDSFVVFADEIEFAEDTVESTVAEEPVSLEEEDFSEEEEFFEEEDLLLADEQEDADGDVMPE